MLDTVHFLVHGFRYKNYIRCFETISTSVFTRSKSKARPFLLPIFSHSTLFVDYARLIWFFCKLQDGVANGKPKYRKLGNHSLLLTYTNAPKYPTPWTMWGGPSFVPGSHIGNIKLGPSSTMCPENSKVSTAQILSTKLCYNKLSKKCVDKLTSSASIFIVFCFVSPMIAFLVKNFLALILFMSLF